jgi:ATP-binding cassette subfamily F protein 3
MPFVQFTGVSLAFGDRDILVDADIKLENGSCSALAGANGSGKSTLMKVMSGFLLPDSGSRAIEKGSTLAYLPQSGLVHRGKNLWEEAESTFSRYHAMLERCGEIESCLQNAEKDDERTKSLLREAEELRERVAASSFYRRDKEISQVLAGLGFAEADFERPTDEFSGGRQMRIALAKVLLERPDILLLDEPTNYLDIEGRAWLLEWLGAFKGAFLLVSHDRYFLDACVNEVYELFMGRLKRYAGNYSAYERQRASEIESLVAAYKVQQEEIARSEEIIRRFRYKASKAAMVQERVKKLEKMERIEIPENLKKITIKLPPPPHSGRIALKLEGAGKSYGPKRVFSNLDLCVESGERLLVIGANGAGKSTLLRIMAGMDKDHEGSAVYGAGIQAAWFSQDAAETLCGVERVLDYIEQNAPTELIPRVRDMLGAFLFRGDDVQKSLNVLSGGEKSRLALLRLLLRPVNLLILDEPTNHLDLYSKDMLLDALRAYGGTIVFVSHDRAFMEALSQKTLSLEPGLPPRLYYGNYAYFLEKTAGAGQETDNAGSLPKTSYGSGTAQNARQEREAEKKRLAALRKLKREEEAAITLVEKLEAEKKSLENEISRPEVYSSGEKAKLVQAEIARAAAALEAATAEWERIGGELEALK